MALAQLIGEAWRGRFLDNFLIAAAEIEQSRSKRCTQLPSPSAKIWTSTWRVRENISMSTRPSPKSRQRLALALASASANAATLDAIFIPLPPPARNRFDQDGIARPKAFSARTARS